MANSPSADSHDYGALFIVSAPSGAGKTSLVKAVLERVEHISVSISHTTRAKRPKEKHGVNYHFVDTATFEDMIARREFFEYAHVFGRYYGTSHRAISDKRCRGEDVILEIDWQGARQACSAAPEAISIFILPPSREALERRLHSRGQDAPETIARRMQDAISEISHYNEFDYVIINDDFNAALRDFEAIIHAERVRRERVAKAQRALLEALVTA